MQFAHVWPFTPHVGFSVPPTHAPFAPPAQHPAHPGAQMHEPPRLHAWPVVHVRHVAPLTPHVLTPFVWHAPPPVGQQPLGHECASHWHDPPTHSWPFVVQSEQLPPPVPHVESPVAWQPWLESQQPVAQLTALHPQTPVVVSQTSRPGHEAHTAPAAPHALVSWLA